MPSTTAPTLTRHSVDRLCVAADPRGDWTAEPPQPSVTSATSNDLALVRDCLAEADRLRATAAQALVRIRARGDGEQTVGMPIAQYLLATTRERRVSANDLALLGDVLGDLPLVARALDLGRAAVDQAAAVARHAQRVGLTVRRALDDELCVDDTWLAWTPEHLAAEVGRLVASLTPRIAVEREGNAPAREYLHVWASPDGQAVLFKGRFEGENAALFDGVLDAASTAPRKGTVRGPQHAAGLARVLRQWACGSTAAADTWSTPPSTIHLLVDERTASEGAAGELWSTLPGLAPTLTAPTVRRLGDAPTTKTITVLARDGNPVAVLGRAGHAIDDPEGLSWDTLRALVRVRDGNRCRMPGCDRPLADVHHLVHRTKGGMDRLRNLAGLCTHCHHRVLHARDWAGHADADGRLHLRRAPTRITTSARKDLRLRRPPPIPDQAADDPPIHLDPTGQPLPF